MIRNQSGIYALYRREKLYYVGLASNLMGRLKAHLRDRHHGAWDRFSVYLTVHDDHMKELESLILRIVAPAGNRMTGKFMDSESLRAKLNNSMKNADADRRARLLGGKIARKRRRSKTKKATGTRVLEGLIERRIVLKAWRGGEEYRATLRKDGRVSVKKEAFESPSRAGKAVLGRECNGWSFWHYRDKNGDWVPLKNLRK